MKVYELIYKVVVDVEDGPVTVEAIAQAGLEYFAERVSSGDPEDLPLVECNLIQEDGVDIV